MAKKILTDLDATGRTITATTFTGNATTATSVGNSLVLKADTGTTEGTDLYTFNGGTAKTLNIVAGSNITITKTSGQWTIASSGGGGSGFTGAGTSITGIAGATLSGSTAQTSASITLATGGATSTASNSTSGTLTITTGDSNGGLLSAATVGNLILGTGSYSYDSEEGGGTPGKIFIGTFYTDSINIGGSDLLAGAGGSSVNIIDKSSSAFTKTLNLANNGGTTNINIGTAATTPTVKIATTGTTPTVQIGTNVVASRIYNFGKVFTWQPTPTTTTTARLLTAPELLTFIIINSTATTGNLQLPTPANMDSNVQSAFTDVAFEWSVINTAASGSVTVTLNGAHTVVGNMVITFGTSARFRTRRSAATPAYVTYRIS